MRDKIVCTCALLLVAGTVGSAQTKHTFSGKCAKADNVQSIPAGDKDGHVFMVQQGKCTTDKGELGSAKSKDGIFSEHDEVLGNHLKAWGVYVETYDNGDKIFYSYQGASTTKDGALVSGSNTWRTTGGTGKMQGIKGAGGCKLTPGEGGGLNYACTGEYTLAAAKQ
jgi:hypothetical protein